MKTLARPCDTAAIVERLMRLRPDSPRQWGRMSAPQVVCHLIDATRMALGEKAVRPTSTWRQRTLVRWMALYAPMRWPPGIESSPELDQCAGAGTPPRQFSTDVDELVRLVERFTSRDVRSDWPEHPLFGRLPGRAWLRWGYLHMDHHLRQFGV
jgi:Protein of unknown function (DUF1569)